MQGSWVSLGYLTITAGVPQLLTANLGAQVKSQQLKCRAFCVKHALSANTGLGYVQVGSADVRATGVGVLDVIPCPTLNAALVATSLPSVSPGQNDPRFPGFDLSTLYLDGDHTGDKFVISYLP